MPHFYDPDFQLVFKAVKALHKRIVAVEAQVARQQKSFDTACRNAMSVRAEQKHYFGKKRPARWKAAASLKKPH